MTFWNLVASLVVLDMTNCDSMLVNQASGLSGQKGGSAIAATWAESVANCAESAVAKVGGGELLPAVAEGVGSGCLGEVRFNVTTTSQRMTSHTVIGIKRNHQTDLMQLASNRHAMIVDVVVLSILVKGFSCSVSGHQCSVPRDAMQKSDGNAWRG